MPNMKSEFQLKTFFLIYSINQLFCKDFMKKHEHENLGEAENRSENGKWNCSLSC